MTQPIVKLNQISRNQGDRLIRAMVADGDVFAAATFSETEVESVMQRGADQSVLVLRSGAKIPVALSYEDLEQKIYSPNVRTDDSSVLDLRAVTGEAAKPKVPANTNKAPAPGDKMDDGTIFAGVSPDTGKPMYALPADAPLAYTFNEAQKYAQGANTQKSHAHDDWRVPSKNELNVLFNNRAAIGGFNVSGSYPSGWYWSSSPGDGWYAWGQRFSDGFQFNGDKGNLSSVRLVR
jgi:hypothetical protein